MNRVVCYLCFLFAASLGAAKLVPCPDCERQVSPYALMCPGCGCKGGRIEEHARRLAEKAKPKEPDRVVVADFGRTKCEALPVRMDDGLFVVMPLEKVLDLETLEFSFASTNLVIGYSIPEVAVDQPLIRFPITETNLLFAVASTNISSSLVAQNPVPLASVSGWQAIQPKALKNHGRILLKIKNGESVKLPPKAHPYYKFLADQWSGKGE